MAAVHSLDVAVITNQSPPASAERVCNRSRNTPRTSEQRQRASLNDRPIEISEFITEVQNSHVPHSVLYLAYGSNLCAETFRGKRNIKPLSQINVVVPQLSLTFDLPGIPYKEPCFGNSRYRDLDLVSNHEVLPIDYHKDRWHKGMVGVVYEVTAADYVHIIATEGGGSGYKDVTVDCYALDEDPNLEVPVVPTTMPFKAHTLFCPPTVRSRPDPSYAEPSARYKKLITDGAQEHNLPYEYRTYLDGLRTYQITTIRQRMGQVIFLAFWGPLIGLIFMGVGKMFLRKDGTFPKWYARLVNGLFGAVWISYDTFFKKSFGDGERTIGDDTSQTSLCSTSSIGEKCKLLPRQSEKHFQTTTDSV